MKKLGLMLFTQMAVLTAQGQMQVRIASGTIEGTKEPSGIYSFKGIPYARPPVGTLRWKEPQPVDDWKGVRKADRFSHHAMQKEPFGNLGFRSSGMSEDCLYLNVWAPVNKGPKGLPVLVYFYGGGFIAGDGSERRYDGESMANKGIIAITVNYRLGIFGFIAHPELTKESPHHASGNYGFLDQVAALRWVQHNIAAFGGDPSKVTIAGESAGSLSVFAHMVSPLSKMLIAGGIGECGSMMKPILPAMPLPDAEHLGAAFGKKIGANTLAEMRELTADKLLEEASQPGMPVLPPAIDGYFLTKQPLQSYLDGEAAKIPLLTGWNSAIVPYQTFMDNLPPTPENYRKKLDELYKKKAGEVARLYPGSTPEEVSKSATALASDRFLLYTSWKWATIHAQTSGRPVYRYYFSKSEPPKRTGKTEVSPLDLKGSGFPSDKARFFTGAPLAFEIEYAMGNLSTNSTYAWTADDHKVSDIMQTYFENFVKTGNPNGDGVPQWIGNTQGKTVFYINIDVNTMLKEESNQWKERYSFLDKEYLQ